MARRALKTGLTLFVLTTMWASCLAQPKCTPALASLAPCLGFLPGNTTTAPSSACCAQLASIVKTQTQCLCAVLNGIPQLPFFANQTQTQALTLPGACKIQTPPLSQCNAATSRESPAPASPAGPSAPIAALPTSASATPGPQAPSGNGSETVATTGQPSSAKTTTNLSPSLLLLLVAPALSAF